jgi:Tfp pilus assembly protein PilO
MFANRTSRWSIGAALLCIAVLAASWFLLINPRRAEAADIRTQAVSAQTQGAQLQVQVAELKAQFADLSKRRAELKAIKKQLPAKADIPALVRQLQTIANRSGVALDSITPAPPALLGGATAATAGSVVGIPVAVSVTGDYFEASLFIKNLQTKIGRSYLITGLAVTSAPEEVAATATPTAAATSTALPTSTATAVATVAPTATPTPLANPLARVTIALSGSVFVLMDGTSTVADVAKEVQAGVGGTPAATPTTGPAANAG